MLSFSRGKVLKNGAKNKLICENAVGRKTTGVARSGLWAPVLCTSSAGTSNARTDLELNTRAFTHLPFRPVVRTKEWQLCAHIYFKSAIHSSRKCQWPLPPRFILRLSVFLPAIICLILNILLINNVLAINPNNLTFFRQKIKDFNFGYYY